MSKMMTASQWRKWLCGVAVCWTLAVAALVVVVVVGPLESAIGNWKFAIRNSQFSILNSQFSILSSQFSARNSQFANARQASGRPSVCGPFSL